VGAARAGRAPPPNQEGRALQKETDQSGALLENVLAGLEALNQTPVGRVIYEQIAQVVREHGDMQVRIAQAYSQLTHLLLDAYAREPSPDQVTRINARLLELRAAARHEPRGAGTALQPPAPATTHDDEPPGGGPSGGAPRPGEESAGGAPAGDAAAPGASPGVERRINSAYRLHLDRKRDEIEKLQEALARNVGETISQNREFGALLQIELRALQQADGAQEIEQLRQILIGGIEELINSQRQLDTKLHRTADYLDLIKGDSAKLRDELHKVRLLSLTDEFTGLPNRRAFMRRLHDEIGRAQRYGTELALALIDLDGFKAINDEYGHAAGDEILRCYAGKVLTALRHHDLSARYGGEEFAVLLPNTTREGAMAALDKMRSRVQEVRCMHQGRVLPIPTFSAGLTLYVPGESHANFIDRADRALYRAKNLGRNRVETEIIASTAESTDKSET
jgi:diguanylate cyclase (GGDEF)-like protein